MELQRTIIKQHLENQIDDVSGNRSIDGCVELVTKNGRPLKLFEDSGFQKITNLLFKAFKAPVIVNRHSVRDLIVQKAVEIRSNIKQKIKNLIISIKVDCATRLDRSIIGINVQLIINGKLQIFTLAMKEMHCVHTGLNLSTTIIEVLGNYDISLNQIYTLTVDNGRNIVRAGAILNEIALLDDEENSDNFDEWELEDEHLEVNLTTDSIVTIRCACHTLQLAVKDFLKEVGDFLPKVRDVVKKLRTPTINNLLKLKKLGKAMLDCPTRWNSTFLMCERLVKLKIFCQESSTDISELYLSSCQWSKIENVVEVLRPVYEVTIRLQKPNLVASEFYFAWYTCTKKIERKSARYCNILLKYLKIRGKNILYADPIVSCVYLDPRYQLLLTPDQKETAKRHLKILLKRKSNLSISILDSSPSNSSINSSFSTDDSEHFLKQLENSSKTLYAPKTVNYIDMFDDVKRLPLNTDIYDFWDKDCRKELKDLAQIIMAIPATQVSVERAFSTLKFVLSDQRASIDENLLEDILLINMY